MPRIAESKKAFASYASVFSAVFCSVLQNNNNQTEPCSFVQTEGGGCMHASCSDFFSMDCMLPLLLTVRDTTFSDNKGRRGGAVYARTSGTATFNSTELIGNTATEADAPGEGFAAALRASGAYEANITWENGTINTTFDASRMHSAGPIGGEEDR